LLCQSGSFSAYAPAKINWLLHVVRKRDDGFHDIVSLLHCVNLYDTLVFEDADCVDILSDLEIPLQENLVYKAFSALQEKTSCIKGARIRLKKQIPVNAGLGGGSSDAACTLSVLNRLWGLHLSLRELSTIAAAVGSDVPFFLRGPSALVEGRGEKVRSLKIETSQMLLLVKPPVSVSTEWAYNSLDAYGMDKLTKKPFDIKLLCQALNRQDYDTLGKMLNNDLEQVVAERFPVILEIKQKLLGQGAAIAAMSGSGPTVFGVFENREKAEKAAGEMKPYSCWVVETLR
jgi:4-diphosphocytidyl-2-C-methyl-D-erythritol kinase